MDFARRAFFYYPLISLLFICSTGVGRAQSVSPDRTDTQSWNDVQVNIPLNKEVDFLLLGSLRFGRNLTGFVDERVGAGLSIRAGKYLNFTPSYLYIAAQPSVNRKSYEHRLRFAATVRFNLGRFTLSDRNQFERRIQNPQDDTTRYRNRFQVEHPISPGGIKMQLFINDEIFYDSGAGAWTRNRFSIGVTRKFTEQLTTDFYYMRQNDGRSNPGDLHVIGTIFRVRL